MLLLQKFSGKSVENAWENRSLWKNCSYENCCRIKETALDMNKWLVLQGTTEFSAYYH